MARGPSSPSLPIIDLSGWEEGDTADKRRIAGQIRAACVENGFFYLVGHGVPDRLATDVLAQAAELFALPAELKQLAAKSPAGFGYARMGGRDLQGLAHPAVKEEFYLGREGVSAVGNVWPAGLPRFRATMTSYVDRMLGLAERLMTAIAVSLDLPEAYFSAFCTDPIASLRLVRYPPEGAEAGTHTDFGALTFLLQDAIGGLQVFDRASGGWIDALPVAGSFVVNLGDLMERWTNKLYRSTPHRVVHRVPTERFSAPFFFTGAADYPIECLPSCAVSGMSPAFPPTTPARHLRDRSGQQGF